MGAADPAGRAAAAMRSAMFSRAEARDGNAGGHLAVGEVAAGRGSSGQGPVAALALAMRSRFMDRIAAGVTVVR